MITSLALFSLIALAIDFAEQDFQLGNSLLCCGKACPLFPDLCRLLAGLCFLYHSDKLGSVMLCIFGNGFEHFGNKGQYHIFIDTVLCRAELSNWDFAVLGAGILRNTLAVVGAVDIHLAAAVGTIKQACEGSCFAPAVRVASDIPTDFLHKVKGLLVNDRLMGILENCPFVLRDIMAFFVLEVLSGLEIDGVSQILTLFKNVADGGRTPAVHIFEGLIFVHALAVPGKVSGRNEDFFFFQLAGDLIRTAAVNRHGKDALDHLGGFGVNQPFKAGTHAKWQAIQVLRILKNEVYTGTMVQGRRQKINYKIKKIRDVEESGWIRVPNMHEAIIPQKLFDTVQEVLKLDTCASKGQQAVNLFSGIRSSAIPLMKRLKLFVRPKQK